MSSLHANIEFKVNEKFKIIEIHPQKPLIFAFDRNDGKICLWDYIQKKNIIESTVYHLFFEMKSLNSHGSLNSARHNDDNRLSKYQFAFDQDELKCNTYPSSKQNLHITNKMKQEVGLISYIAFADCSYIKTANGFQHYRSIQHYMNSDNLIVIVCEQLILFYDYVLKTLNSVSVADIHRISNSNKTQPTCVEQIYFNMCVIGNSDGVICLYDLNEAYGACHSSTHNTTAHIGINSSTSSSNQQMLFNKGSFVNVQFQTGSKYEIVTIKSIPCNRKFYQDSEDQDKVTSIWIRFVTVAADGQALIWDLDMNSIFASKNNNSLLATTNPSVVAAILPIAKLSSTIGGTGNFSKNDISYDYVTDQLHICCHEKKIRVWDLDELQQGSLQKKSNNLKSSTPVKRTSMLSLSNNQSEVLANNNMYILNSVEVLKVSTSYSSYARINSNAKLRLANQLNTCYVTSSRSNGFAVWQHNSQYDESNSDTSSAIGNNKQETDKTILLVLKHEFTLQNIMQKYWNDLSKVAEIPEATIDVNSKIYSIHSTPAFPNILTLSTSFGLLVISFQVPLILGHSGSIHGTHPRWGMTRFIHSKSVTKRVSLKIDVSSSSDISVDTVCECNPFVDNKKVLSDKDNNTNSQPIFNPSPSGTYCAIIWPHQNVYMIYSINNPSLVLEKGKCIEFGWIGSDDHFLLKGFKYDTAATKPTKRISIKNMLFGTEKAVEPVGTPQLFLRKCEDTKVYTLLIADFSTIKALNIFNNLRVVHFSLENIETIFSGNLISINSIEKKENNINAAIQYNSFYTLVTTKWLKTQIQHEVVLSKEKEKGNKKNRKGGSTSVAHSANIDESSLTEIKPSDEYEHLFLAIGPKMKTAEMIRWDYSNGFCVVVFKGSSQMNILRLSKINSGQNLSGDDVMSGCYVVDFQTIGSVDLNIPRCLNISTFYDLTWFDGVLFYTCNLINSTKVIFCHRSDNDATDDTDPMRIENKFVSSDHHHCKSKSVIIDVIDLKNNNNSITAFSAVIGFDSTRGILMAINRIGDVITILIPKYNSHLTATFLIHGSDSYKKTSFIHNSIINESLKWLPLVNNITEREHIAKSILNRNIPVQNVQNYYLGEGIASKELKLKTLLNENVMFRE